MNYPEAGDPFARPENDADRLRRSEFARKIGEFLSEVGRNFPEHPEVHKAAHMLAEAMTLLYHLNPQLPSECQEPLQLLWHDESLSMGADNLAYTRDGYSNIFLHTDRLMEKLLNGDFKGMMGQSRSWLVEDIEHNDLYIFLRFLFRFSADMSHELAEKVFRPRGIVLPMEDEIRNIIGPPKAGGPPYDQFSLMRKYVHVLDGDMELSLREGGNPAALPEKFEKMIQATLALLSSALGMGELTTLSVLSGAAKQRIFLDPHENAHFIMQTLRRIFIGVWYEKMEQRFMPPR